MFIWLPTLSIAFVADLQSFAQAYLFKRCPLCLQTLTDSPVCVSYPPAALRSSVASSQLPAKIQMLPLPFPTGEAANDLVHPHQHTQPPREQKHKITFRLILRGRFFISSSSSFFLAVGAAAVAASAFDLHSAV